VSRADENSLKIFSGRHSSELARRVCTHLDLPLGQARTESFPDGEIIVKLDEDVRGRDCFVVISTCSPVNENLVELLIWIDCLKRASAKRITVVIPYFGYGRQDRKDEGRVPITAKLIANLITAAGADRVLTIDLHAAQIQGFFDIPVDHLHATPVFYQYVMHIREELGDVCLVSPDVGNMKVAESFANLIGGELAIINKRRISGSEVTTGVLIGNVKDKSVLMLDDMITTAGTVTEAARLVKQHGARRVIAMATHPVLAGMALQRLAESPIERIVCCDTIPSEGRVAPIASKFFELSVAQMLGEAIHRIHHNLSISALFRKTAGAKR
jgi:ribose-phosphate pyrophosphokinase